MRKLFALFLALALMAGILPVVAEPAPSDTPGASLPAAGDVIEGFEVIEVRPFEMIGSDLVLFEHQKTGAKLLYIANADTNRAFQLTFPTRPVDNTGLPHVFEHSTLSGSSKYPSTSLWMNLAFQTYNTYINAYTTDAMTSYPLGSLSEAQLLALAEFYTDCCLHPQVTEVESIYRTEAWRYEMEDMDSPLTLNGTVYSEMTGALTISRAALNNANGVTFPGAALSYDYGGVPDYIPDMTWDALRSYHDMYYHPSNCMAILYGSFEDYTAFLKLLNEEFSPYDKKEFSFTDSGYTRITEPVIAAYPYPMAEGTDTANQTSVYYYILCPGLKDDKPMQRAVDHVGSLLNTEGSVLMQNLKEAFPSGRFSCGREVAAPDDAVIFTADSINLEDAETFRSIVNDSLKQIARDGFDPVQLDSVVTAQILSSKLALENSNPIESVIMQLAYDYAVTGNPFEYAEASEDQTRIMEENDRGLLTSAISTWLADPSLYTLTTTYPAPGEKEKKDAALTDRLAEIKAGMSDEEKQAIIDATNAEPVEEDTSEMIASLTAVSVKDLPEEVRQYEISDVTAENGVRYMNAVAGVDGVGKIDLFLDARTLPQEDIHYLRLYTRLLGQLGTDTHSKEELAVLMDRYLMGRTIGVDSFDTPEKDDVRALLQVEWIALDEDLAACYDLVKEVLFHTQFTDLQTLSDRITAQKSYVRNQINSNPYIALRARQEGIGNPWMQYYDYLNYTAYYAFLEELEQQMASEPEAVVTRLQNLQSFLANRAGAVAAFAGNETSIAVNKSLAEAFFADMTAEVHEYPVYDLPVPPLKEGVSVDGNIQYNLLCASFSQLGMEPDYALSVIGSLIGDQLLYPVLRDQMGAYSVWCGMDDDIALYIISYRDPNLKATFDLYDSIPEKLSELELTQEQVNGYILNAYSDLAKPAGELNGAVKEITRILHCTPADETLKKMRAYKGITPESVKASAAYYTALSEKGARGTVGPIGTLQENSDLFDAIQNPFHTEDLSQISFSDVSEDNEHHDAIYAAFTSGMMLPKEDGVFAPDEPATVGDFLGGLYMLIGGGSNDPDACKSALMEYGLVDADQDLNAELHEDLFCNILTALGAVFTTDTPDAAVSRADLADVFVQLTGN